jgi:hypothetical protein
MATIKCRTCGGMISQTAEACPHCGEGLPGLEAACPQYGSEKFEVRKAGISLGKAVLFGVYGAFWDKGKVVLRCRSCGHEWKPETVTWPTWVTRISTWPRG